MSGLKAVIIDDEKRNRVALKEMIETYCEGIKVIGLAENVVEGVSLIKSKKPDVIFLDIEMPQNSGFNLIEKFDTIDFDIVFTTAYEQYAIRAFRSGATGYLLKPINIDELIEVVEKVKIKNNTIGDFESSESLGDILPSKSSRVIFPTQKEFNFVKPYDILYLHSSEKQTTIFLKNGEELTTTKPLNACLEMLQDYPLVRINRNNIINWKYIAEYRKGDAVLVLENKKELSIGRFYKEEVNKLVSYFIK